MSLLPLLFSAWWADLERPHRLMDQNFGLGLFPEQLMLPINMERLYPMSNKAALEMYYRPLAEFIRTPESGSSTITADKDTFKVILDVQQFKPEEISLKLVDRFIVVEAKHEEKKDEHGLISRQFIRKYLLPNQADEDKLTSTISSDGILTITAPIKATEENPNERTIKIEMTGKPAIRADTTSGSKTTAEQTTADQTTTDQTTADQTTADQTTADQTTADQTTADQTTTDQTTADQATTGASESGEMEKHEEMTPNVQQQGTPGK